MQVSTSVSSSSFTDNSFEDSLQKSANPLQEQNFFSRLSKPLATPQMVKARAQLKSSQLDAQHLVSHYDGTYGKALKAANDKIDSIAVFKLDGTYRNRSGGVVTLKHEVARDGKTMPLALKMYLRGENEAGDYRNPKNAVSKAISKITHAQQKLEKREDSLTLTAHDARQIRKAERAIEKNAAVINSLQLVSSRR